jgi:hypothetical protein
MWMPHILEHLFQILAVDHIPSLNFAVVQVPTDKFWEIK